MGITDRLKDLTKKAEDTAAEHKEQIQQAVQKAGTAADERTGGRYSEQIQKVGAKVQTVVDRLEDPSGPAASKPGGAAPGEQGGAAPGEQAKSGEGPPPPTAPAAG